MKKIITLFLLLASPAFAQSTAEQSYLVTVGTSFSAPVPISTTNQLPIAVYDSGNHSGYCYTSNGSGSAATFQACGSSGGSGTVTSVSVTTANGVSGTVATATTTPAISLTLGAITPSGIADTGTMTAIGSAAIGTSSLGTGVLSIGAPAFNDTTGTTGIQVTGNINNFFQDIIQNTNAGSSASADLVLGGNDMTATTHYVDIGKNGSAGGTAPFASADAGYFYTVDGELDLGANSATGVINLAVGSSPTTQMTIGTSSITLAEKTIFQGSTVLPTRVVTASGAVTVSATTDYEIIVNKTVGAATIVNLPASPATGLVFIIKDGKGDAATNNITVTPAAGNIDGSGTYVINYAYGVAAFIYNGTQWNQQ